MILILDYGSQTTQLIARRIREKNVYSHIVPFHASLADYRTVAEGIVLSGGPASVYHVNAPDLPSDILSWNIPVLGICYGAQLLVHAQQGKVGAAEEREFGRTQIHIAKKDDIFFGIKEREHPCVWMSHGDRIAQLPKTFEVLATSDNSPFAAFRHKSQPQYGVQFHPEVTHTTIGDQLLDNFLFRICQAKPDWTMKNFVANQIETIRTRVGNARVISALSGGVDSSVVTRLLQQAIGNRLTAIFVDTGLLRLNEVEEVEQEFRSHFPTDLRVIHATDQFFQALRGVEEPEQKRKIIGNLFVRVFEKEAQTIPLATFLAQGTLYPDVIESSSVKGPSATIKTHHNVGGLPDHMNLTLIEPLRDLFKDEVRRLGVELELPKGFVERHPFPGPGLAVRVIGQVTKDRVHTLQLADAIFMEELRSSGLYEKVWQAFAVLLPVRAVGVMGDERTYENVCTLRAVTSLDGMTADWAELPHDFLGKCANRIINEVRGINRVVYDISSKPPATIEWE